MGQGYKVLSDQLDNTDEESKMTPLTPLLDTLRQAVDFALARDRKHRELERRLMRKDAKIMTDFDFFCKWSSWPDKELT